MRSRASARTRATAFLVLLLLCPADTPADAVSELRDVEEEIHAAVNGHREESGRQALAWSEEVAALARQHSSQMASGRSGFGHEGFQGRADAIAETIPLRHAAENIARQQPKDLDRMTAATLASWLDSRRHRKNLEGDFDVTGVGAARGPDGSLYFTQIFVARKR